MGSSTLFATALRRITATLASVAVGACVALNEPGKQELTVPTNPRLEVIGAKGPLNSKQAAAVLHPLNLEAPDADALKVHLAVEQAVAGTPLYTGNRTRLLRDGGETFPAMFDAIKSATHSVYLEYYIFEDIAVERVHLSDLLASKRAAGVEVAVIYDSIGSNDTPAEFFDKLKAAGVRVTSFNPINPLKAKHRWSINDRDHRKMLIADDRVAIIGGINMATTYESGPSRGSEPSKPKPNGHAAYWRDTDLEIKGPAVAALVDLYREHWRQQSGADLPPIVDPPAVNDGTDTIRIIGSSPDAFAPRYYATVLSAINTAKRTVWVTAAYFVPTRQEKKALVAAAQRGVDVRLLLPSQSDSAPSLAVQRSSYSELLKAGVKVFERDGVILHTKAIVVDSVWSIIGSSNFDHRSVLFNDEVDAVVLGSETAGAFENMYKADLESAHPIVRHAWARRSIAERIKELFWRASTTLL
jgi:cardiolipin synthase